ncbi:acetyl-CoA C-acyltransferase [Thermus scotoductus]|uniref:Acetyl-CoA C-acyltransferase n=2 Tax=Thermus scotoductus TaxID=37636 RepID=A0A430RH28_THESC|nr:acetyl-CoA C-acyltransferase [Thermus scotoductus]RTH07498.1 acetyl-CoA C-acyltransferase [Thermus scotoductus]RTH21531.1 acetyl-CoA C-acyltransferase [Thermus scotoductus]RTI35754.1 acetyl-CoA C-acyltransferase [Thermus scotoductus]
MGDDGEVANALGIHPSHRPGWRGQSQARLVVWTVRVECGMSRGDVVTGCVTQTGEQGANIGRLAVLLSRLPQEVPAVSLNRMCGSSQQAVHFAAQAIAAGDLDFAIAGGVESMTRSPMFSDIGGGFHTLNPALFQRYELVHQGESAERIAKKYGLCREELDEWGYLSHRRAARAIQEGRFRSQILPLEGVDGEGRPFLLDRDEGVRFDVDYERMLALKPVFREDGVVTAGNSSQVSDGAAALLLGDREKALALGLRPRARFLARVVVAGDPTLQLLEVIPATKKALEKAGLSLRDLDVIEINEAFASVVLAFLREFGPQGSGARRPPRPGRFPQGGGGEPYRHL